MRKTFDSKLDFFYKNKLKRSQFLLFLNLNYIKLFLVNLHFITNMKTLQINLFFLLILFSFSTANSQKSIVVTGGKAIGTGGTAGFSVGQISYKSPNGNIVSDGVQQPYEIATLEKSNFENILLEMNVFPNPTSDELRLKIGENQESLSYQLFDINGKSLSNSEKIIDKETIINMKNFYSGIYFLKITSKNQNLKTFKIIKK